MAKLRLTVIPTHHVLSHIIHLRIHRLRFYAHISGLNTRSHPCSWHIHLCGGAFTVLHTMQRRSPSGSSSLLSLISITAFPPLSAAQDTAATLPVLGVTRGAGTLDPTPGRLIPRPAMAPARTGVHASGPSPNPAPPQPVFVVFRRRGILSSPSAWCPIPVLGGGLLRAAALVLKFTCRTPKEGSDGIRLAVGLPVGGHTARRALSIHGGGGLSPALVLEDDADLDRRIGSDALLAGMPRGERAPPTVLLAGLPPPRPTDVLPAAFIGGPPGVNCLPPDRGGPNIVPPLPLGILADRVRELVCAGDASELLSLMTSLLRDPEGRVWRVLGTKSLSLSLSTWRR